MTPAPCGSHPAAGAGHSALQPEPRRRGRLWAAGGGSGTAPTSGNKRMLRAWARLRGGARQPGALRGRFAAPRMTASPAPAGSQTGVLQGGRAAAGTCRRRRAAPRAGSTVPERRGRGSARAAARRKPRPGKAPRARGPGAEGAAYFGSSRGFLGGLVGRLLVWVVSLFVFNVLSFFFPLEKGKHKPLVRGKLFERRAGSDRVRAPPAPQEGGRTPRRGTYLL